MVYQDFDLLIDRTEGGFRAQVLNSPAGQATSEFRLPFSEDKLENFLLRLGRTRRTVRRVDSPEMNTAKTFGASLFNAVFSGDVRACFRSSLDEVRRQGAGSGLRVRLRLMDPELVDLPWEYLYNPSVNRFIALSVQTPLVRYMDLAERIQPIPVTPPIRVLVMISSPTDFPSLDVEAEWTRLNESLHDLLESGHIAIDRLDDASLGALQRRLRQSQYHIFHFIGHGEFDQDAQEGVLILEGENERGHRVSSQYLGMLLHDHESLRVAILNACEGARTSRTDPFAGSAQSLVQQGIPAVIAMQFEIADDVASTFAHEFYGALADGYPIDAALTEARKAIFAAGREVEWGTPVLYLRAPDGRIFDVERSAPPRPLIESERSGGQVIETPRTEEFDREELLVLEAVSQARSAFAAGQRAEALAILRRFSATPQVAAEALRQLTLEDHRLTELELREAQEKAEREEAQRKRGAAEDEARAARQRQLVRDDVMAAADLFAEADLSNAWSRVRDALQIDPADPDAVALEARVRRALDEAKAQAEAREHERELREESERARGRERAAALARERDRIDRHLTAGELEAAHEALAQADAAYAPGPAFADLRTRLAKLQRQARARYARSADDVIAQARNEFVQSPAAALGLLERFSPPDPSVSAVYRELKQLVADQGQQALQAAEHRAAEERDRQRVEEQRQRDHEESVQRIEAYLEQGQLAEAGAALGAAEAAFGLTSLLQDLRGRLADGQGRSAFNSSATAAIAAARGEAASGNYAAAITALETFAPPHDEVGGVLDELRQEAQQQERPTDVHRGIADLIASVEQEPSHSAALASLQEAPALDPDHAGLQQAIEQRRAALRMERAKAGVRAVVQSRALVGAAALVALAASVSAVGLFIVPRWKAQPPIDVEAKLVDTPAPPPVRETPAIEPDKPTGVTGRASGGTDRMSGGTDGASDGTDGESSGTDKPPSSIGKPTVTPETPIVNPDLLKYRRAARRSYAERNKEEALSNVTRGLAIDKADGQLQALLDRIVSDARKSALIEREAATNRKATGVLAFRRGDEAIRRAQNSPSDAAARTYWEAVKYFKDAVAPAGVGSTRRTPH
jgi:CHAT domain